MKLPKTLYVRWGKPLRDEDAYLQADTEAENLLENASDEKVAGVYELQKVVSVKSTVSVSVQQRQSSRTGSKSKISS